MQHDATGRPGSGPPASGAAERQMLAPLGSLPGFKLAAGEPDIRGWDVLSVDGRPLGVVDELLVDRSTDEISALAVRLSDGLVVVPMAEARIDTRMRAVFAEIAAERLAAMPRGSAGASTTTSQAPSQAASQSAPHAERAMGQGGVTIERTASGEEIVRVPIVEEELVVERRPVVKEVVVIRKRTVEEQHVVEADLRRERLEVDRRDQR